MGGNAAGGPLPALPAPDRLLCILAYPVQMDETLSSFDSAAGFKVHLTQEDGLPGKHPEEKREGKCLEPQNAWSLAPFSQFPRACPPSLRRRRGTGNRRAEAGCLLLPVCPGEPAWGL